MSSATRPSPVLQYPTIESTIGETPLVRLQRLVPADWAQSGIVVLGKLEGNNPAGSVKDRAALSMIEAAERRGEIHPGDTLIEATSGNTGIALAMVAAVRGYRMVLIMPENQTLERRQAMAAYGARLVLVSREQGMEGARDLANQMAARGEGRVLDQFGNDDNWQAHFQGTGPEIWRQTQGTITHFVSAMGTTGTITGVSRFLKAQRPDIRVIGAQPAPGAQIPGIRKWPQAYLPGIFRHAQVDEEIEVGQAEAETMARRLAAEEGIFCGISAAGACHIALAAAARWAEERPGVPATVVFVVCDRGDRYLSMGVFPG